MSLVRNPIVPSLFRLAAFFRQSQAAVLINTPSSTSSSQPDEAAEPGFRVFGGGSPAAFASFASPSSPCRHFSTSSGNPGPGHPGGDESPKPNQAAEPLAALPPSWRPYALLMRLDKPIGTALLAWPCFWSIALGAGPGCLPDLKLLALFGVGSVLLRGAGCTVNDLWDIVVDKKVERTRTRPLASGALRPSDAIGLLAAQLALGLVVLLQLNDFSKLLGASSLLLVGTYPLMKRVTFWPQAFLGLTINWGALLGYSAALGYCEWSVVLPLYASGVCWSLVYDTIYAHQDKVDDVTAGVKSTALLFGDDTKAWVSLFAALQVACLCTVGYTAHSAWPFYVGVGAAASHLAWQIKTVDLNNGSDCMRKFVSNKWLGGIIFVGIVGGQLLQ